MAIAHGYMEPKMYFLSNQQEDHYFEANSRQFQTGRPVVHNLVSACKQTKTIPIKFSRFTKVESGADAFAASKAIGYCKGERNCFVLSTGGEDVPLGECVCNNSALRICHKQ